MQSGKLRDMITVYQAVDSISASGESVVSWSLLYDAYADVRLISGREYLGHDRTVSAGKFRIYVRGFDIQGINSKMRIGWKDHFTQAERILNIEYISEDRTHERLTEIICFEVA
jgi:head-tail adaptor